MRKISVLALSIILTACSWGGLRNTQEVSKNPAKISAEKVLHNQYIQEKIKFLEKKVENGEITKEEASKELKQEIIDLKNLNNGSTKSILKKFEMINPKTAKILEEKIRKNHPEALKE